MCQSQRGWPKYNYPSRAKAMRSLVRLANSGVTGLSVYQCVCGYWHIGHVPWWMQPIPEEASE